MMRGRSFGGAGLFLALACAFSCGGKAADGSPDPPRVLSATPVAIGQVTTLAGSGVAGNVDGVGLAVQFNGPDGLAANRKDLLVADAKSRILRVAYTDVYAGTVFADVGSGAAAHVDGPVETAAFEGPRRVAPGPKHEFYIADVADGAPPGSCSLRSLVGVRTAEVRTIPTPGLCVFEVAADADDNLYLVSHPDSTRLWRRTLAGDLKVFAGSDSPGTADGAGAAAGFQSLAHVVVRSNNEVYVADQHRIRKITSAGEVTTVAGGLAPGSADGAGTHASFNQIASLAFDANDNLYVADGGNARVRRVTPDGAVSTIAGSTPGYLDGASRDAQFGGAMNLAVTSTGDVYAADTLNHRVRKISTAGVGQLAVSWTPVTMQPPVKGYTARASAAGHPTQTCVVDPSVTTCILSGLASGVLYAVTMVATNSIGTGNASDPVVATPN